MSDMSGKWCDDCGIVLPWDEGCEKCDNTFYESDQASDQESIKLLKQKCKRLTDEVSALNEKLNEKLAILEKKLSDSQGLLSRYLR
jgi:hypothetical protein